jgi:hypothetical protein
MLIFARKGKTMFDFTPLEIAQMFVFLIGALAKVGLVSGAIVLVDQIVNQLSDISILLFVLSFAVAWYRRPSAARHRLEKKEIRETEKRKLTEDNDHLFTFWVQEDRAQVKPLF